MTSMTTAALAAKPARSAATAQLLGSGGAVFVGIDTHKHVHQVALIDTDGALVAERGFGTDAGGVGAVVAWLAPHRVLRIGVEQTGTYGAELTRRLQRAGFEVVEITGPDVTTRARHGKSDAIDAQMAAQGARTGRANTVPKDRTGVIEALRPLHAARGAAVKARTAALAQIGDLAITAPSELRDRLGTTSHQIVTAALKLRPDIERLAEPLQALKYALRSVARRVADLDEEIAQLNTAITALITPAAPHLLARPYVGVHTATQLMLTAGQNPDRIGTEAQFARLTGVAPIPASSGKTNRMRLHRGGDRQANRVIYLVAVGRLRGHQPAIDYLAKRTHAGDSKTDAVRAMKRHIARELYGALKADLKALDRT